MSCHSKPNKRLVRPSTLSTSLAGPSEYKLGVVCVPAQCIHMYNHTSAICLLSRYAASPGIIVAPRLVLGAIDLVSPFLGVDRSAWSRAFNAHARGAPSLAAFSCSCFPVCLPYEFSSSKRLWQQLSYPHCHLRQRSRCRRQYPDWVLGLV